MEAEETTTDTKFLMENEKSKSASKCSMMQSSIVILSDEAVVKGKRIYNEALETVMRLRSALKSAETAAQDAYDLVMRLETLSKAQKFVSEESSSPQVAQKLKSTKDEVEKVIEERKPIVLNKQKSRSFSAFHLIG